MGHGRPGLVCYFAFACVICALMLRATAQAQQSPGPANPSSWTNDAELVDLCFLDCARGWAVGQHGVIWQTVDGGASWKLAHHQIGVRLASVSFVDDKRGWAVGSRARPRPSPLEGVVLRTIDGGATWTAIEKHLLPAISHAQFFDAKTGIACGWGSAVFASGVYITEDAGETWTSLPLPGGPPITAACLLDSQAGLLARADGKIGGFRGPEELPTEKPANKLRAARGVVVTNRGALAAGDGGLLLINEGIGQPWPPAQAPSEFREFNWSAVASVENSAWIAGDPGTHVLATHDGGVTWQAHSTGQSLPIRALEFVDEQTGYAAGALGTILKTTDGGRSWQLSRSGGRRAAWLALYGDPRTLPPELAVKLSAASGQFGAARFFARRDCVVWPGTERETPQRAEHLFDALGMCETRFAWGFPARERGILLDEDALVTVWNGLRSSDAREDLAREVARAVLAWRPEVVITAAPQSGDPLERIVAQAVLGGVEKAAGEEAGAIVPGAASWQVKKVLASRSDVARAVVSLAPAEISAQLGCTLEQFAEIPRTYLSADHVATPGVISFDVLMNRTDVESGQGGFFAGISAESLRETRRESREDNEQSLDLVHRAAQKGRNLKAIFGMTDRGAGTTAEQMLSRLEALTQEIPPEEAGELIRALAQQYQRMGDWELAAEAWSLLAARYPSHPLAAEALQRLLTLRTSGEAAHRFRGQSVLLAGAQQASLKPPVQAMSFEGAIPPTAVQAIGANVLRPPEQVSNADQGVDLLKVVIASAGKLEQADAALYSEPATRYPLAVFQSRAGARDVARRYLSMLAASRAANSWTANAAAELWLSDPRTNCPKPLTRCASVAERPYLDGQLDDEVWSGLEPIRLTSPYGDDSEWRTTVRIAHDEEFLYVAARCHCMEMDETQTEKPARDADLQASDRLEIYLDIDRDYTSYYILAIDRNGGIADSCLGDATWNPRWYVAHAVDEQGWNMEAAIELAELCDPAPARDATWAIGLQRVDPRRGFQAASFPASPECQPAGFGLLRFE